MYKIQIEVSYTINSTTFVVFDKEPNEPVMLISKTVNELAEVQNKITKHKNFTLLL